jgi:hypothetical protein
VLTLGEQRTLVVLVNFQDDPSEPWTTDYARDVVFNRVSNFFLENSRGQTWFTGDVVGWFTLPMSAKVCDASLLASLANQAAASSGMDLTAYKRYVYAFPGNPCGWDGYAAFDVLPSRAWIGAGFGFQIVSHELGHNFGLGHSGGMHCDGSPLGSPCISGTMADPFDVMTSWGEGHLNAFHKERLGWLNYGSMPPIMLVRSSGTYEVEPIESPGTRAKALKILKSMNTATGERIWYYVEVRRALGFDSYLPAGTNALEGVLIRVVNDAGDDTTLLDMGVGTADMRDAALPVGQTFTDEQAGISMTPLSVSDAGATIEVTLGPGACAPGTPSVKLTSSQSAPVAAGTPVTYALTLTNTDSAACSSSSFNLSAVVPTGWNAAFASPSLAVAAGGSASTTMQVTSALTAVAGPYSFTAKAVDSSRSAVASGSYSVAAPLAIHVSSGSPAYSLGSEAVIVARVSKGAVGIAGATVTFRITPPGGRTSSAKAVTNASGEATYVLSLRRKATIGTYSVLATVTTGGSSASATTTFSVY